MTKLTLTSMGPVFHPMWFQSSHKWTALCYCHWRYHFIPNSDSKPFTC